MLSALNSINSQDFLTNIHLLTDEHISIYAVHAESYSYKRSYRNDDMRDLNNQHRSFHFSSQQGEQYVGF